MIERPTERVHVVDALRGFSLFGILLANLLIFQYGMFGKDMIELFPISTFDEIAYDFTKIAIEGSFLPIFALLFGFSLVKLSDSLKRKNARPKWHLFRRGVLLLAAGLLHSYFIWEGDILAFYGGMAILLLPFVHRKPLTVAILGLLSLFLPLIMSFVFMDDSSDMLLLGEDETTRAYVEQSIPIYANGSYTDIHQFVQEVSPYDEEMEAMMGVITLILPFITGSLFLLGMWTAKVNFFHDSKYAKWYKLGVPLVLVGLILKAIVHFDWSENLVLQAVAEQGPHLLAFGYILTFAQMYYATPHALLFKGFEAVGKLSLTNYIMQSVIATFIFYGYGFGLFGSLGVWKAMILGLIIYTVQCFTSVVYLRYFKRGPLETLLRIGTNLTWKGHVRPRRPKTSAAQEIIS